MSPPLLFNPRRERCRDFKIGETESCNFLANGWKFSAKFRQTTTYFCQENISAQNSNFVAKFLQNNYFCPNPAFLDDIFYWSVALCCAHCAGCRPGLSTVDVETTVSVACVHHYKLAAVLLNFVNKLNLLLGLWRWCFKTVVHCVSKNIPDIFDCNLKTNYQILIIFGKNISDTTCHQMTVQFPTSSNECFCTT